MSMSNPSAIREKAIEAALELARRTGVQHTADDLIKEAKKIEAYLEGLDDRAPNGSITLPSGADHIGFAGSN